MFNEKNTDRATHYLPAPTGTDSAIVFYDLSSHDTKLLDAKAGEWVSSCLTRKAILHMSGIVELSRPQSDIDALFDGAPDWVRSMGKVGGGRKYWLGDTAYSIPHKKRTIYSYGSIIQRHEFTIIATRSKSKEAVVDVPAYTESMKEYGETPTPGMLLNISFVSGSQHLNSTLTYLGDGVGCFKDSDGKECTFATNAVNFDCIDQRTDEERTADDIKNSIESMPIGNSPNIPPYQDKLVEDIKAGKVYGVEYTGK